MAKRINPEAIKILTEGTREERMYLCEQEPIYFGIYYFPEFFDYPLADFHYELWDDFKRLVNGELDEALWIAFRESAKTSIAKMGVTWIIAYRKKRFISYDSYDKANAEAALFDIAGWLEGNEALVADFGQLFNKKKGTNESGEATLRRISNFITSHGVMVRAYSTQESVRGRIFKEIRPDFFVNDDIETNKTKESRPVTMKIISHYDEMKSGLGPSASVLNLGNYITDDGVIAHIKGQLQGKNRKVVRDIPVIYPNGVLAWPGKYTLTNQEAAEYNKTMTNPRKRKVSLTQKRSDLGDSVFETEMLNNPAKSGDLFFDRARVDYAMAKVREPLEVIGGLKIWERYNMSHRYGGGADTAEGIGGDSNASAWIDFTRTPNAIVGTFDDNQIAPNIFGWALKKQGDYFGRAFLVPELNNTGYATISELLNAEYYEMYQRQVANKTSEKMQKEWGWKATTGTKWEVLGDFKEAFESGQLEIFDKGLLEEMRFFTKADARLSSRQKGATRHFDKLRAAALAWHARGFSNPPKKEREKMYKSPHKTPYSSE